MDKEREKRYHAVREMIKAGEVKTFDQLFHYIPKTVLAEDAGIYYDRFETIMKSPREMTVNELFILARILDYERCTLLEMLGKIKGGK